MVGTCPTKVEDVSLNGTGTQTNWISYEPLLFVRKSSYHGIQDRHGNGRTVLLQFLFLLFINMLNLEF
jgi:hypothetical protein